MKEFISLKGCEIVRRGKARLSDICVHERFGVQEVFGIAGYTIKEARKQGYTIYRKINKKKPAPKTLTRRSSSTKGRLPLCTCLHTVCGHRVHSKSCECICGRILATEL